MSSPIAPALSKYKIEALTLKIRRIFNINGCYFDIIKFMEVVIPIFDPTFNFEYVDSLPDNAYAFYDPMNNSIKVLESVYENACNGVGRDRFTIAHEIGHYFLHSEGFSFARTDGNVPAYRDPEWQANTFASFLLIPRAQTLFMDKEEIASRCMVSNQAAEIAYKRNRQ